MPSVKNLSPSVQSWLRRLDFGEETILESLDAYCKQPPHYGQFETCDSCCVLNQKQHEKIKPVKRQKTAAEKLKAKEA